MALSNLANEPRREIIEQGAGMAVLAVFLAVDYVIVCRWGYSSALDLAAGMFLVGAGLFCGCIFGILGFIGLHALGEVICGWLASFGLDPRPTQRYRR